MKFLITGAAGFIGFHLVKRLLKDGFDVVGIDNMNDYYCQKLKNHRLKILKELPTQNKTKFTFFTGNIEEDKTIEWLKSFDDIDCIIHLAAQAGVRESIKNPHIYMDSNLIGFYSILNYTKEKNIKHFIFASSSSVYGNSSKKTFSETDETSQPISFYAATKKANEILAHAYSHLYGINCTGLRFFTVYGPHGRPDMAYYHFVNNIKESKVIDVFNEGKLERDFTYIDDCIEGIKGVIDLHGINTTNRPKEIKSLFQIYNIGNGKTVKLLDFIKLLEDKIGMKAKINLLPMQEGDVLRTQADITKSKKMLNYMPKINIDEGLERFIEWHDIYHK